MVKWLREAKLLCSSIKENKDKDIDILLAITHSQNDKAHISPEQHFFYKGRSEGLS